LISLSGSSSRNDDETYSVHILLGYLPFAVHAIDMQYRINFSGQGHEFVACRSGKP
jgi:hypothetical protein